jgi:hypothetical protein
MAVPIGSHDTKGDYSAGIGAEQYLAPQRNQKLTEALGHAGSSRSEAIRTS